MSQRANKALVVEMRGIKKHFGAVQALKGVDLALHRHEVLGLLGDNAAGKSTLMKVLSGAYSPTEGGI
jgi:ABC-type sugar transport system ATPase subunit